MAVLGRALDELAIAYHDTPESEPSEDDATPHRTDYRERYSRLPLESQPWDFMLR
jgi:hypothetical protein